MKIVLKIYGKNVDIPKEELEVKLTDAIQKIIGDDFMYEIKVKQRKK